MASQPAVTLSDIARHAGVSLATASRVLNGSLRTVGEDFRERVRASAAELGYTPNAHAQAVARGTTNVVGLVVHDITDPYFSTIAAGAMDLAEQRGLIVLMANTWRTPDREVEYLGMLRAQRARAAIIVGSRWADHGQTQRLAQEIQAFQAIGAKVACISQNRLGTDTVLPENRAGARALARALVDLGHRRFAVLAGPRQLLTGRDRLSGFRDGLKAEEIMPEDVQVLHGPFTRDGGYAAAAELVARPLSVTCVFAVNDVMAVGAMAALRDHGVRVPQDLSIAGFDDIATLRDVVPPLTTVRLPLAEMGRRAAEMALDPQPRAKPRVVRMRGEVILRESTRTPPSGASD